MMISTRQYFLLVFVVKRTANIDSGYVEVDILGHEFKVASERLEKPVCSNL